MAMFSTLVSDTRKKKPSHSERLIRVKLVPGGEGLIVTKVSHTHTWLKVLAPESAYHESVIQGEQEAAGKPIQLYHTYIKKSVHLDKVI